MGQRFGSWRPVILVLLPYLVGCDGCDEGEEATKTNLGLQYVTISDTAAAGVINVQKARPAFARRHVDTPENVVSQLLTALCHGDGRVAASLLTSTSTWEMAKHRLALNATSLPGSTHEVAPVAYFDEENDEARVRTIWTRTADGSPSETHDITWVLRRRSNGWRVAGMETVPSGTQMPILLDFENPGDALRKLSCVAESGSSRDFAVGVRE